MHTNDDAASHGAGGYTIHYRSCNAGDTVALIVTDEAAAYLFSGGGLQVRCAGRCAAGRLAALLRGVVWMPVPLVAPYNLASLRGLMSKQECPIDGGNGRSVSLAPPDIGSPVLDITVPGWDGGRCRMIDG